MASNLYLFFGEDSFSALEKLNFWKAEFEKKYGEFNIQIYSESNPSASQIHEALQTLPFLSEKKLILVKDFLANAAEPEQKKLIEHLEDIPDYCVLVFFEDTKPDGRLSLYKKITKLGEKMEFKLLEGFELKKWIEKRAAKINLSLTPNEINYLINNVGPNLWQLHHEIDKISLHKQTTPLSEEQLENLIPPHLATTIWKLTESVSEKKASVALKHLSTLLENNEDLFQIFFMLVRQFRILLQIKNCQDQKLTPPQITKKIKEHPFTITLGLKQSQNFSTAQLEQIYQHLLQIDINIKSGKIRVSPADNTELRLSIEELIIKNVK